MWHNYKHSKNKTRRGTLFKFYIAMVVPAFFYEGETWTVTNKDDQVYAGHWKVIFIAFLVNRSTKAYMKCSNLWNTTLHHT